MPDDADIVIVIATCPNENEAELIARKLVESKDAACVQLNPIRSIYRWQAKIVDDAEFRLLIKTTNARYADVERLIKANASYQNPEVVAVPVVQGSRDYLDWVVEETT